MKVAICYTKNSSHGKKLTKAFTGGVNAHGDEVVKVKNIKEANKHLPSCDVTFQVCDVTSGKRAPEDTLRSHILTLTKKYKKRRLILDTGLIQTGKEQYHSIGFDGIKGAAEFYNKNSPQDRRDSRGIEIKPWRESGEAIYILCQTFKGAGLKHIGHEKAMKYFKELPRRIREYTDRPIVYRLHPKQSADSKNFNKEKFKQEIHVKDLRFLAGQRSAKGNTKRIENAFDDMYCCITRTSAGAIMALVNGIPSISEDEYSICNPVCDRNLSNIENILKPDREQWVNDLCYAEWSMSEIESGKAWTHLKPNVNKNRNELTKARKSMGINATTVQ